VKGGAYWHAVSRLQLKCNESIGAKLRGGKRTGLR
jgi:hypothetical protein